MLTPDAQAEFEKSTRDVLEHLLRSITKLVKEMSEADTKSNRVHYKAASKLFQAKLEHARTAASVSIATSLYR